MKSLTHTIIEYQSFGIDDFTQQGFDEKQAKKFFNALEDFAKEEKNKNFLGFNRNKLKAQNYVGIIQTPYGTLEILPKCFDIVSLFTEERSSNTTNHTNKQKQKQKMGDFFKLKNFKTQSNLDLFDIDTPKNIKEASNNFLLFCLSTLKKSYFKVSQFSSLNTKNTPLLEIFIQMFCNELLEVCKKGICHDYIAIENNRTYLKGKLLFDGQIRHNLIHKERFYTSSDEYIADIAPNRLIKSTLKLLSSKSTSSKTQMLINYGLEIFEEIPLSTNYKADFLSCTTSRHFSYYDMVLSWCRLFLENQSFTPYSGESKAYALLFPMEKLFESYVAHMLKKSNPSLTIKTQSSEKYLLQKGENGRKIFLLKPDILIDNQGEKLILDTKWKIPDCNQDEKKNGISQADLYQMWAYATKFKAKEVWLIYPFCQKTEKLQKQYQDKEWGHFLASENLTFCQNQNEERKDKERKKVKLKILFAPLFFIDQISF